MQALHARTANGRPHWVSRLRAADMIFRLSRAYDRKEEQEPPPDPEREARNAAFLAEMQASHIEVQKYFVGTGELPGPEMRQRLESGETTVDELEQTGEITVVPYSERYPQGGSR